MDFNFTLRLPEDPANVALVRHVSRDVLGASGVAEQDVDDIVTMVGELATNAVCHAHDQSYTVELTVLGNLARITVIDKGVGFFREWVSPAGTIRSGEDDERFGGWGLPLVESLSDRVEYIPTEPHGTTVLAEKRVQKVGALRDPK